MEPIGCLGIKWIQPPQLQVANGTILWKARLCLITSWGSYLYAYHGQQMLYLVWASTHDYGFLTNRQIKAF